jgi:hypothetical protein
VVLLVQAAAQNPQMVQTQFSQQLHQQAAVRESQIQVLLPVALVVQAAVVAQILQALI